MSDQLNLKYNAQLPVQPGMSAVCSNTNDGSPSLVTMKNTDVENKISVSVTLGQESVVYTIFPKEQKTFPENGAPKNFEGLVLTISNNNQPGTSATLNVLLTAN